MSVTIRLLGVPQVTLGERSIDLPPGKSSALLYYLAYKGEWVSRDELVYLFWPDSDESAARKNLRQLLTTLRRLPYTDQLETEATRLRWSVASDTHAFKQALSQNTWATAAELYQGALLQGFQATDLADFEEWLELERQDLQRRYREAVFKLVEELTSSNRHGQAADVLTSYRKHDPLDEEGLRKLLQAQYQSGQQSQALETFKAFEQTLERELGGEPEARTLHLLAELKAAPITPPTAPVQARHNLPVQPTPLLGREAEVAEVSERLTRPECRLLTLTGPGGIGKTRLSLEVAKRLAESETFEAGVFEAGVWFVSLSTVTTAELLVSAIADALRFSFYGAAEPKAQLFEHLRDKELLLVLDNFEQLVAAAPLVAELLATCPGVKALVTSREGLRLRGEQEVSVPPLALPDLDHLPLSEHLSQYAAVQLFIDRARAVKVDFEVTNDNAPAVAEICHRLDGLPLAIELAAARVKLFAPQALLARLATGPLKLLSGGARDLPARQQTLKSTIAWSYDLLDVQEQTLFARLAVFVGGRSLEAVETVCNIDNDLDDVIASLTSLVDKCLLRQEEANGEPRFVMLKTLYDYARERLEASSEADNLKRRHAEFYLALAEEAEPHLTGPEQATWLERLETDHDNFRAALGWTLQGNEVEVGLGLAGALWQFWDKRGHFSEGRGWLERALSESRRVATSVRARALNGAGVMALVQGDYPSAQTLFEESLAINRELGDKRGAAPLANLGHVACDQGNYPLARARYEESLLVYREVGDRWGVASSLVNLGIVAGSQGDYHSARTLFEESLVVYRELGEKLGVANSLTNLGTVACAQEDYQSAYTLHKESLAVYQELGNKQHIALSLASLGDVADKQGDLSLARTLYTESLVIRRELGAKTDMTYTLEKLASLATHEELERAARLWGAAEVIREAIGAPLPLNNRFRYEEDVATAHSQLGEAAFTATWAQGREMTLEQAVAYALQTTATDEPSG